MHFSRCWSVLLRFRAQPTPAVAESETAPNPNGWIGTETVKIPFGNFDFKNGYPTPDAAAGLLDQLKFNRAIEVYLTQMMPVSEIALREGVRACGAKKPMQVVVWEDLMDARTVLLTANAETVYAVGHLDFEDRWAYGGRGTRAHAGLLPRRTVRPRQGRRRKFLVLPPGFEGELPEGYFVVRSPTGGTIIRVTERSRHPPRSRRRAPQPDRPSRALSR
jgi:hypothetical protein